MMFWMRQIEREKESLSPRSQVMYKRDTKDSL